MRATTTLKEIKRQRPGGPRYQACARFESVSHDPLDRWLEVRLLGEPVPSLDLVEDAFGRAEARALSMIGPMADQWMTLAGELWTARTRSE